MRLLVLHGNVSRLNGKMCSLFHVSMSDDDDDDDPAGKGKAFENTPFTQLAASFHLWLHVL